MRAILFALAVLWAGWSYAATRTISALGGNWDDVAAWTEAAVPTAADDVVADALSGDLTINVAAACRSFNMTDYTGTVTHDAQTLTIGDGTSGAGDISLKFVAGMTYSPNANALIVFQSTSATQQSIDWGGKTISRFRVSSGSYALASDCVATGRFHLSGGTLDAAGFNVSVGNVYLFVTSTATLVLGTGTWTVSDVSGDIWTVVEFASLTLTSTGSTIYFTDTGASDKTFHGGDKTYNIVRFEAGSTGEWTITGSNTFEQLINNGTGANTFKFTAGTTTTLIGGSDTFFSGSNGNVVTCKSTSNGSAWNLVKTSGTVDCEYLSLQDSAASGGAVFTALNSTNVSGNSGWGFGQSQAPRSLALFRSRR